MSRWDDDDDERDRRRSRSGYDDDDYDRDRRDRSRHDDDDDYDRPRRRRSRDDEDDYDRDRRRRSSLDFDDGDFVCPYCDYEGRPVRRETISTGGWILFAFLILFCIPLCWLPFVVEDFKERSRVCLGCGERVR
jgi:hypothetical protein